MTSKLTTPIVGKTSTVCIAGAERIDDLLGQRDEARATIEKLRTGLTTLVERLRWCDPYLEGDAQDLLDIIPPEVK